MVNSLKQTSHVFKILTVFQIGSCVERAKVILYSRWFHKEQDRMKMMRIPVSLSVSIKTSSLSLPPNLCFVS